MSLIRTICRTTRRSVAQGGGGAGTPPLNSPQVCRALQKSLLFVRWRHRGILRASACMIKFHTAYCASSHIMKIYSAISVLTSIFVLYITCCEAQTVNCTRAIEHRIEIAKCFLTVGILRNILRLCIPGASSVVLANKGKVKLKSFPILVTERWARS